MDKAKNIAKEKWQDRPVHRASWKSDLKGAATGKKKDPYEGARNHQSAPLSSLKDPASFAPPPRHSAAYGSTPASPSSPLRPEPPRGGLGSAVPAPSRRQQEEEQRDEEEAPKAPPVPYRIDTSGLRTDHLPKPPVRRADGAVPTPPARNASPALPPRHASPRQAPIPTLPPRMNDHPDEFTPPPPPTYTEATEPAKRNPASLNTGALNRLGQAGVSVPGLDIGAGTNAAPSHAPVSPAAHGGQLSELQQMFARMNAGAAGTQPSSPSTPKSTSTAAAAAAHKKPPPPPPPKKAGLSSASGNQPGNGDSADAPPPLPMSSKPRPT